MDHLQLVGVPSQSGLTRRQRDGQKQKDDKYGCFCRDAKKLINLMPEEAPGRTTSCLPTVMSGVFSSRTSLPLLAFLSTSLLLFFAYNGAERPHGGRIRYPHIPPPGASDINRLHYSKFSNLHRLNFRTSSLTRTFTASCIFFLSFRSIHNQTRSGT